MSISPSTEPELLGRYLVTERLARTVCEIDPTPRNAFGVAVILEVLGYTDQRAKAAGWPDVFALARDIFDHVEYLRSDDEAQEHRDHQRLSHPGTPSPLLAVVTQQVVWLVMMVLMMVWGRSIWSADRLPPDMTQALVVGILGSLIVSGGFQYAMTRRLVFHIAQRDLLQTRVFLHRTLWSAGLAMAAGALVVAAGFRLMMPGDRLVPLVAAAYFLLHGNYRVAIVPLIAINDVVGIVLSMAVGVGLLAWTYERLIHTGTDPTIAIVASQLIGLTALWLSSLVRARSSLAPAAGIGVVGTDLAMGRGAHAQVAIHPRWHVLCLDAAPWLAIGTLYYVFLFAMRPFAWLLPPAQRVAFEAGTDLGLLGIVPMAIVASVGLHRFYQGLREQLTTTPVVGLTGLRARAMTRFSQIAWRCRWLGVTTAVALWALTSGRPWGAMGEPAFTVFRITLVGLTVALPGFLFAFGLLTSLGALREAAGVLVCGLALQLAEGLLVAHLGTAGWLALGLVSSTAVLGELAVWRAQRVVRNIDQFYYAAF